MNMEHCRIVKENKRKNELYTLYTVQELVEHCLDEENEIEVLNDRINEAIEYIDSKVISNGKVIDQLRKIEVEELLNILNGGDEE